MYTLAFIVEVFYNIEFLIKRNEFININNRIGKNVIDNRQSECFYKKV